MPLQPDICPYCGSDKMEYDASEVQDDLIIYPFTCERCGKSGREVYSLKFEGYDDEEGKALPSMDWQKVLDKQRNELYHTETVPEPKPCLFDNRALCTPHRRKEHPNVCGNCGHNPDR